MLSGKTTTVEAMLSPDQKGAIAELAIAHAAAKLGIGVSRPICEGERYDLIFDLRPSLVRVQCKWAARDGDVVAVRCYSTRRQASGFLKHVTPSRPNARISSGVTYCLSLDLDAARPFSFALRRPETARGWGSCGHMNLSSPLHFER